MIDEKKITNAAIRCYNQNCVATQAKTMKRGFIYGAEWAQEEFIKSLWHDAKEKPKNNGYIITEYFDPDEKEVKYELDFIIQGRVKWEEYTTLNCIMKWCYLSDILPKKGGNNE